MAVVIRKYRTGDETQLSKIIIRCLREVNARDYPSATIEELVPRFSPENIAGFASDRQMYVAESSGVVVGTASLARDNRMTDEERFVCLTVFVLPERQGSGVGSALMARVERAARDKGARGLQVPSSITALPFYEKLGYRPRSTRKPSPNEHWIWMIK